MSLRDYSQHPRRQQAAQELELEEPDPGRYPEPSPEGGLCQGCGVRLDDAGIVVVEPYDEAARLACGPWLQESCGECELPLSYWRLMGTTPCHVPSCDRFAVIPLEGCPEHRIKYWP